MDLNTFLATATELLALPSTADRPDQLRRAVDWVVDFVGPGFTVERFESAGKPSALLYADAHGGAARPASFRAILNAHLDVVSAEAEQFRARIEGDRIYARGAQDMKVTGLVQAQVFREVAPRLPYPLALQLVADEEVGGRDGTLHQLEQGVTGEFVVIGEHSRLDIVADSKGLLHARLRASGRGAHGAYPWLGDNAVLKLVNTVTRLLATYPPVAEEAWRTTVNLSRIDTPNRAYNQVPADAQAWLDIRFPAEDDRLNGRTMAEVAEFLVSFTEPGVSVQVDHFDPPQHVDHDNRDVAELRRAAQRQGYPSDFLRKHGAGDGGFYSGRGIAAVAFGVGGAGQHGPDEYAEISTITPYYRALKDFLERLRGADEPGRHL
ncbi:M20 family metallopeptidase [Plantactinospora solaniradicis]|uniref:M20 family metallopeptidase n=1 Tax=Plantactinospora solaniradicis TaxID=1723736 RepID=A0ABW1KM50_9ACTN